MRVLLVDPAETLPVGIDAWLAEKHWTVDTAPDLASANAKVERSVVDAVVLSRPRKSSTDLDSFLGAVESRHIPAVMVGDDTHPGHSAQATSVDLASADITKEELSWRLATLTRFQKQVRRMERELDHMQRLSRRLDRHFHELDDEMRLASRLQRDFLPRDVGAVGPLRFGTLYRPASWVSGDLFDIQRIDDTHVGFYVVDAVGHGVAAGLLTMFIKRAMVNKRERGGGDEIVDPGEALRALNDALARYTLPNCQFVTGVYCVVDTDTLKMRFARGGHPYPILIPADRRAVELKSIGGLMGLFEGMEAPTHTVQLHPGDKVILFTDGIESAFAHPPEDFKGDHPSYRAVFQPLADRSAPDLVARLNSDLDRRHGSLRPADDVTVLVMEVTPAD